MLAEVPRYLFVLLLARVAAEVTATVLVTVVLLHWIGPGWRAFAVTAVGMIRAAKATGLRNLPCRAYEQNQAWLELSLAAADLLTWARALCFTGSLARCEPAAFRYRITHMAGRLVRTGRRWQLRLDQDWPWADNLASAFARLRAAPWPA